MHIYVDFDDCLCETARAFSKLAPEMFNKDEHGLQNARLYCLNKYGRDHFIKNSNSTRVIICHDIAKNRNLRVGQQND